MQRSWSYVPGFSSSPVIDTGMVVAAGHPVAGATVILFPVQYGKQGGTVQPVARTVTGANGQFAIRLPVSDDHLLINSAYYSGSLNLHVMAFYPGGWGSWFVPVQAGKVAAPVRLTLRSAEATGGPAIKGGQAVCSDSLARTFANVPVEVGYKDSGAPSLAWASYTYATNASTTMGAGISDYEAAGFSDDGTTTQSAGGSWTWPEMKGAGVNDLLAAGLYYDYYWICASVDRFYVISLNSINSATGSPGAEGISAGYCSALGAGIKGTYYIGTQRTWVYGANLHAVGLNIDLSSQDGWSTSAYSIFQAGSKTVPVCGLTNYPNATDPSAGWLNVHN
jgi:hypothetical protein